MLNFQPNDLYFQMAKYYSDHINDPDKVIICNEGGSRSSKTWDFFHLIVTYCDHNRGKNKDIYLLRDTLTNCRDFTLKEFTKCLNTIGIPCNPVANPKPYFNLWGNNIYFRGLDDEKNMEGFPSDISFVNEALETKYEQIAGILMRCTSLFAMDWNPKFTDHWAFDFEKRPNCLFTHSTYKNNKHLPQSVINEIESYDTTKQINIDNGTADDYRYKVYNLGLRASPEGLIFPNVQIIDELPEDYDSEHYGIDFGYTCFSGETLITTINGDVQIKDINPGDLVLTRSGYRKVLQRFDNGISRVIQKDININGCISSILATFNHNFNANGTWKKYGQLAKKDRLFVLSNLMGKHSKDTQTGNTRTTTIGSGKRTEYNILTDYTKLFTDIITVKFPKAWLFIISTLTLSITGIIIWLRSHLLNIALHIQTFKGSTRLMLAKVISRKLHSQKQIGRKGERSLLKALLLRSERVIVAELNTPQQTHIKDSVITNAITNGSIIHRITTLNLNARSAIKSLWETSILNPKRVATNAHIYCREITDIKTYNKLIYHNVYDLEVEGVHEYFANGILVHNCDPSAIVQVRRKGQNLFAKLRCYTPIDNAMTLSELLQKINPAGTYIADSADPGMIASLRRYGNSVHAVGKYPGSIKTGIDIMKRFKLHVVRDADAIKEVNNYKWRTINGISLNEPIDKYNHFWDSFRYVCMANFT